MSAASRSRRPSSRARRSRMTSDDAVKKRASILRSHATMHSAEAMCVLPVLTSPTSTRSSQKPVSWSVSLKIPLI